MAWAFAREQGSGCRAWAGLKVSGFTKTVVATAGSWVLIRKGSQLIQTPQLCLPAGLGGSL